MSDTQLTSARPRARRARSPLQDRRGYWLYFIPGGVLLLAVILVPFAWGFVLSFSRWSGVGDIVWVGLDNYRQLLSDSVFLSSFANVLAMIVAVVVIPTLLGLVIAAVLFDYLGRRFAGNVVAVLRATFYLPQIIPIVIAGIVWGWVLQPDGSLNTILRAVGLGFLAQNWLGQPHLALGSLMTVLVWVQIGYPVVVFMAALSRVDPELYEAAQLDGAGAIRRFRAITIPQIRPETFVVVLTCTVAALKVFGPVYALTSGGPGNATYVPSYLSYQTFFQKLQVGYGSAMATVLALLVLLVSLAILWAQRRSEAKEER